MYKSVKDPTAKCYCNIGVIIEFGDKKLLLIEVKEKKDPTLKLNVRNVGGASSVSKLQSLKLRIWQTPELRSKITIYYLIEEIHIKATKIIIKLEAKINVTYQ